MSTIIDTFTPVNQPEYYNHFWNYLMGKEGHETFLDLGRKVTGAYVLPTNSSMKFAEKLKAESRSISFPLSTMRPTVLPPSLRESIPTPLNGSAPAVLSVHTMPSTISAPKS